MFITLVFSIINSLGYIATIALMLVAGYLFLTGFWGAHNTNRWFIKYKYRLPTIIWHIVRIPIVLGGIILGFLLWGLLEHLFLLLAMEDTIDNSHFKAFFVVFLLLLPYFGPYYADKIDYNPSKNVEPKF